MANVERPGVEISQTLVTTPSIPPIVPVLQACVVGPSYQIVDPLTSDGAPNPAALVSTSARVVSSSALSAPVAVQSKVLKVAVDGGNPQICVFPATTGTGLSFALIEQNITKNIKGVTAKFVNSKLVILSNSKGASSSIALITADNSDALSTLGLAAGTSYGVSAYDNLGLTVPFSSLPATKTAVKNLTIDADKLAFYKQYANAFTQLSKNSALNHNSWVSGAQGFFHSVQVDNPSLFQPVTSIKSVLVGEDKKVSVKTDTVYSPTVQASVVIPLGHSLGGGTVKYPDPTGSNYLKVVALASKWPGKTGNSVAVKFLCNENAPAASADATVAWDEGSKTLTFTVGDAQDTKFSDLETAVKAVPVAAGLAVSLAFSASDAEVAVFNGAAFANTEARTFLLSGGADPINFVTEVSATKRASVTGCAIAEVGGVSTATALGVADKKLYVSLNGHAWVPILLVAGTSVVTAISNALVAAHGAAAGGLAYAEVVTSLKTLQSNVGAEDSTKVLRITAAQETSHATYKEWQDSTVQVRADDPVVIARLFSGESDVVSSAILAASTTLSLVDPLFCKSVIAASVYAPRSVGDYEKPIVPGNQTITASSMLMRAALVFKPDTVFVGFGSGKKITLTVNGDAATLTLDAGLADYAAFVANLKAKVANNNATSAASVSRVTLNGAECLVISAATSLVASSADGELGNMLCPAGAGDKAAVLGVTATAGNAVIVFKDTGANAAVQVTSISNLAPVKFAPSIGFSSADVTHLTGMLLTTVTGGADDTWGAGAASITHSTGEISIQLTRDATSNAADKLPTFTSFTGSSLVVSYKKMWPHLFGPTVLDYGRVFHGSNASAKVGDTVYNAGGVLGKVVAIEASGAFANAKLVLSEASVDANGILPDWYIRAEGLDVQSRNIAPEFSVSALTETVSVKHALNRGSDGIASSPVKSPLYVGYSALRKDVTQADANPDLLYFSNILEVDTYLGPIVPENPLAFGLAQAFSVVGNTQIAALGVDDVSADAPQGTPEAYGRAFELLALKEVHCIALLTQDRSAHALLKNHCLTYSEPANKRERAGIVSVQMPTEREPSIIISGVMTISEEQGLGTGKYILTFTDDTKSVIAALNGKKTAGGEVLAIGVGTDLTAQQGVWLDRAGDNRRYLVTKIVSASAVQVGTGYAFDAGGGPDTAGNDDSYYAAGGVEPEDFEADGENCTIYVRQPAIKLATTTGKNEAAQALADYGTRLGTRRMVCLAPDQIAVSVNGLETLVPGFFATPIWAALSASISPAQGFTNMTLGTILRVIGASDLFGDKQLDLAASGGICWFTQDVKGGQVYCRHQLTTDTSSLKTREWSVTRAMDSLSKLVRSLIKGFIGKNNVNKRVLEEISISLNGLFSALEGNMFAKVSLKQVAASTTNPDQVVVDVEATPFFPLNKISVRIVG